MLPLKFFLLTSSKTFICLQRNQAEKLNDERNWRKGLRVRLLLRRSVSIIIQIYCFSIQDNLFDYKKWLVQPKSVLKSRKSAFDGCLDDEDWLSSELVDDSNQSETVDTNVSILINNISVMIKYTINV